MSKIFKFAYRDYVRITTESSYEGDFAVAVELLDMFIKQTLFDWDVMNWRKDVLKDAWQEGISIAEWVARVLPHIPASFGR